MQYVNSLLDLIGNTPLLRLSRTLDLPEGGPMVLAKIDRARNEVPSGRCQGIIGILTAT